MNKQLRQLHVTAKDIGHCLLCGGTNGNCTCTAPNGSDLQHNARHHFYDLREANEDEGRGRIQPDGHDQYLRCFSCRSVLRVNQSDDLVRCKCGTIVQHGTEFLNDADHQDYSFLDEVSELSASARAKPKASKRVRNYINPRDRG